VSAVADGGLCDWLLQRRLVQLLERRSERPPASSPAACRGWEETQAAYRLLRNARGEAGEILEGHSRATLKRIACEPVVWIVQDTTCLEYVKTIARHGVGTLRRTAKDAYLLHPSGAFTPERVNLGGLGHHCWQRPEEPVGHLRKQRPMEAKESYRWLLGAVACHVQRYCMETLVMNIADREGEMHAWLLTVTQRPAPERAACIIRATCNRRLACEPKDGSLWETLGHSPVCGTMPLELQSQPGRRTRHATLSVRTRAVTVNRARAAGGHAVTGGELPRVCVRGYAAPRSRGAGVEAADQPAR
jgi:hypothetical protein